MAGTGPGGSGRDGSGPRRVGGRDCRGYAGEGTTIGSLDDGETLGAGIWPADEADWQRALQAMRTQMDGVAFAAWQRGETMILKRAFAVASEGRMALQLASPVVAGVVSDG